MNDLKNKNIIVTGASGGIGNALVEKFNETGANILATGTRVEKLEELKSRYKNIKIMKLCMIGTGYVGLVSGVCFSDLGNTVYCVDNDIEKINALNKGIVPIYEPGLEEILKRNYKQKRLIFTNNLKEAVENSGKL